MTREGAINSYRDLLVWQKSMALAKQIYSMTRGFPDDERFGLTAQMRRAAISVPSNIAEGQAGQGRREFIQFLSHAEGALAELDTQLNLSTDLGYGRNSNVSETAAMIVELQKMLGSLRRKVMGRLVASV